MSAHLETAAPSTARPTAAPGLPLRGLLAASCTVLCWASAFVAMRVAVRSYPPQEVALLRFVAAAAALGVLALVQRMPLPTLRDVPRFALLGLVGHALYNLALAQGQSHVPAATAGFIIASAPIWMVLMAAPLGQERPTVASAGGMLLSLAGVALISVGRGGHAVSASSSGKLVATTTTSAGGGCSSAPGGAASTLLLAAAALLVRSRRSLRGNGAR
jgi:drug/metabolite transporter (DMT)-like permease